MTRTFGIGRLTYLLSTKWANDDRIAFYRCFALVAEQDRGTRDTGSNEKEPPRTAEANRRS
jgi:hypothetical protein